MSKKNVVKRERFEFVPTPEELAQLQLLAKANDRSVSWVVREAVETFLCHSVGDLEYARKQLGIAPPKPAAPAAASTSV
jgi:predicted DNA-binding protein